MLLLSCCPVVLANKLAQPLAFSLSGLNRTGAQRTQRRHLEPNIGLLPSYKSRRSFGLSSVFPSASRHVGPNPRCGNYQSRCGCRVPGRAVYRAPLCPGAATEQHARLPLLGFKIIRSMKNIYNKCSSFSPSRLISIF